MIKKKDYITPLLKTYVVTVPRLLQASREDNKIRNNGDGTTFGDIDNDDGEFNGLFNETTQDMCFL